MKNSWLYLSYLLQPSLSAYGDGDRIKIHRLRQIANGDTSNNSSFELPAHYGTHIDFPNHFINGGETIETFDASYFIHTRIETVQVEGVFGDQLIGPQHFIHAKLNVDTTFLIIRTGIGANRADSKYWSENPGMAPELAAYLKDKLPSLRTIGMDTISLSGYKNRPIGRVAHKEFLEVHGITLVEDMDLAALKPGSRISQLIVAPLRFEKADGAPVTILAQIEHEN